jgi:hypothetical protein
VDPDTDSSAGRRVYIPAILFGSRLKAAEGRIRVLKIDPLHARWKKRGDGVLGRRGAPDLDLVSKRAVDRFEQELERLPGTFHRHGLLFGARGDNQLRLERPKVLAPGVYARSNGQRLASDEPSGTWEHLHRNRVGEESEARGLDRTRERGDGGEQCNREHSASSGRYQSGPAQLLGWH